MEEQKHEKSHIQFRLNVLFLVVFLFFAAIILRLAYVQLVEGEQYKHDLETYSKRELPIPAPRGRILDRNGVPLVWNKPVYTVTFVEEQNVEIDEEKVADKLAGILHMDDDDTEITDKMLLQKALELNTSLPVSLGSKETEALIGKIALKLAALPPKEAVAAMSDAELVKTALSLGLQVRPTLTDEERTALGQRVLTHSQETGQPLDVENTSAAELVAYAAKAGLSFSLKLEEEKRENLAKDVTYLLNSLPAPEELKELEDMKLLRYAALFDIDVALPLSAEERKFQWHKLAILKEMRSSHIPSYIPRRIKTNISEAEMYQIEERRSELPGVNVIVEPVRQIRVDADNSPFGTYIFGYTKPIPAEEWKEYAAQGYSFTDSVGKIGLERYYERQLRGKDGVMEVHVNKDAETVEKREKQAPEPGNDLVLALDWRFQSKVEQILATEVKEIQKKPGKENVKEAHAVVMNPNTGEILAMASYPDYDLNLYYDQKKFNEKYKTEILPNERNDFIFATYAPGSTVKAISVMLALQEKLTTPEEVIIDRGGWWVGNMYKRNWKLSGHGPVNARRALQVSNNTYMYAMAMRLADRAKNHWKEQFSVIDYYNAMFGLGVKTGIDLPGELAGWRSANEYYGNLADAFIGQYDQFTPIQLAQYVSAIANGGYRVRPHLVKEIRKGTVDPNMPGQTLEVIEPQVLNRVEIDPKWLKVAQEGMRMVTQPGGTAYWSFNGLPFSVAAKTGTAQTGTAYDNSIIVGYAPYEDPQIAFVVIVPAGGHGSDSSGPISRKILEAYHELFPLTPSAASTQSTR